MRLAELVAATHATFDPDLAMADVRAICAHDRYQASAGIAAAADYVADRARAAGLADVTVLSFPADGAMRWWTYRAPRSWTPIGATLAVDGAAIVSYPQQPYALAAYSAPTPLGGRPVRLVRYSAVRRGADPRGALVVADEPVPLGVLAGPMANAGAVAIAADPLGGVAHRARDQVGRLELPAGCELAAFSVTEAQLAALARAADAGAVAVADVQLDEAVAAMPVVTGWLPGSGRGSGRGLMDSEPGAELLLSAHLCHPRPGANDNASGAAALLGIARVLAGQADQTGLLAGWLAGGQRGAGGRAVPGVRFLWGPEFVGTAAYLHDVVAAGQAGPPSLAINIDMAGQDVARCGGPLVIERGPDDTASFLPALTARCAALLPPVSRSYSGAVPCDPWTWRATPFAGGSDHGLLADCAAMSGEAQGSTAWSARCQVVGLGHWPDRANHSSADTPELVDPAELRRTAVIAVATIAAIRGSGDPALASDVAEATLSWAADHVLAVLPGRRQRPPDRLGEPAFDPHDEVNAGRWLRHRGSVALGALAALADAGMLGDAKVAGAGVAAGAGALAGAEVVGAGAGADWLRSALAWVGSLLEATATRLPAPSSAPALTGAHDPDDSGGGPALVRCWAGPANLRALAQDADPADREWLNERLAADRGGNYARALALMHGVDGTRSRGELAWWAALSSELPMPLAFAETFLDLMIRAGWAHESAPKPAVQPADSLAISPIPPAGSPPVRPAVPRVGSRAEVTSAGSA